MPSSLIPHPPPPPLPSLTLTWYTGNDELHSVTVEKSKKLWNSLEWVFGFLVLVLHQLTASRGLSRREKNERDQASREVSVGVIREGLGIHTPNTTLPSLDTSATHPTQALFQLKNVVSLGASHNRHRFPFPGLIQLPLGLNEFVTVRFDCLHHRTVHRLLGHH